MNSNLPVKQRNGIFYKIFLKINQIFRKNKYKTEKVESNEVISNSNKQFKNDIKIDIEKIEFNNEYQKKRFMEQLKNNQELLEKFSNDRLKVILQYYLDENNKKRERLKKISN
jgi:hypothetical protein